MVCLIVKPKSHQKVFHNSSVRFIYLSLFPNLRYSAFYTFKNTITTMEIPPPPRKVKKYYVKKTLRRKWPITYILSGMFNVALLLIPIIAILVISIEYKKIERGIIMEIGQPVEGLITDFWIDSLITKGGVNSVGIQYKYENAGILVTESINTFSITDTTKLKRGESIRIKYFWGQSTTKDFEEYYSRTP